MFPEQPYEEYRLSPGRSLLIRLPAETELHCLQGQARIVPAPQAFGDALHAQTCEVPAGHAYRAPRDQWITLENASSSRMSMRLARIEAAATRVQAAKKNRLATEAARRFQDALQWVFRRAPRAASSKTL